MKWLSKKQKEINVCHWIHYLVLISVLVRHKKNKSRGPRLTPEMKRENTQESSSCFRLSIVLTDTSNLGNKQEKIQALWKQLLNFPKFSGHLVTRVLNHYNKVVFLLLSDILDVGSVNQFCSPFISQLSPTLSVVCTKQLCKCAAMLRTVAQHALLWEQIRPSC